MFKRLQILIIISSLVFQGIAWAQESVSLDVNAGMKEALATIKVDIFKKNTGADGGGVKVAVIDTGVDVSHPDLQKSSNGKRKIIDYADFTEEGKVNTKFTLITSKNATEAVVEGKRFMVGKTVTKSGKLHLGLLKESQLDEKGYIKQDLNRDGDNKDSFGVLVTDSTVEGIYDTVYVDTDLNGRFDDEKPLRVYNKGFERASFGKDNPGTDYVEESSFVVSEINPQGDFVKLSFDGNGHGTHVAGIIGANGALVGVAPGASIIAIKAIGSSGDGDWDTIRRAVEYAKERGADIINISIGNIASSREEQLAQSKLIKKISFDGKTLVVMAAGNTGPGLSTATDAGDMESVMTVGAYMSSKLWEINYNAKVPGETLWYFSGVGPGASGNPVPSVVAPSSVISTVAKWDSGGYFLMDGTSMAAPFVSGSAALLIQKAKAEGMNISAPIVKRSLEMGARKLEGYLPVEQGYGLIDVMKSWELLKEGSIKNEDARPVEIRRPENAGYTGGILLRNNLAGEIKVFLTNLSNNIMKLKLKSDPVWIRTNKDYVILPRGKPRQVFLSYDFPQQPGVYSAKTLGYLDKDRERVFEFITTAVRPYELVSSNPVNIKDTLMPARWKRYFFKVTPGMSKVNFNLIVLKENPGILGRGLMYIYAPDGQKVFEDYAGSDYIFPRERLTYTAKNPAPGVWEAVVVSDYNLSDFHSDKTSFNLSVSASGVFAGSDDVVIYAKKGQKQISQEILLKNGSYTFRGHVIGFGMADESKNIVSEDVTVKQGELAQGSVFTIPAGAMYIDVKIAPTATFSGDVDLYLYKKNPNSGKFEEVASSAKIDVSNEEIRMIRPAPGEYLAYIDGFSVPGGSASFKISRQVLVDQKNVTVEDATAEHKPGTSWKVKVNVDVPESAGKFIGILIVQDEDGNEISQIPIKLYTGKTELLVEVLNGGKVTVRRKDTLDPVDTTILVNGLSYPVYKGTVHIPENIKIKTVEIYDGRFAPVFLEY